MTAVERRVVGEKGQLELPKNVLEALHLKQGSTVDILIEGEQIVLRRAEPSIMSWLGAAPLPDGQTEAEFMRELRGHEAEAPAEGQSIIRLKLGLPFPETF